MWGKVGNNVNYRCTVIDKIKKMISFLSIENSYLINIKQTFKKYLNVFFIIIYVHFFQTAHY